ncbi:MAG: folate family ECF transporter S component [Oscillospiraceae bacterium]|nr:folate family ECF transporter S component [Oscillospiraceae bacterium]
MVFLNLFKDSAKELKNIRCLATTGILIAAYVVMNSPLLSLNTEVLKITFGYLALAAIAMLYGPVVAMIAAVPCDIITALVVGSLGVNLVYTLPKILEALIYGMLLYGYGKRLSSGDRLHQPWWAAWQVIRIVLARFLVMSLCYLLLNSYLLYFIMGVSSNTFAVFMYPRFVKNVIQFPIDLALMLVLLPILGTLHIRVKSRYDRERAVKK